MTHIHIIIMMQSQKHTYYIYYKIRYELLHENSELNAELPSPNTSS
jgi:hypothetical protein